MLPKREAIQENRYENVTLSSEPGWWTVIGLQIENLILNNHLMIFKALHIDPMEIVRQGPYFQRKTQRTHGCQIDYLIQTKLNSLFACEIKFSHNILKKSVVSEMQEKLARFSVPKRFVVHPVLIHCNEVSEEVRESEYFYRIIDFTDLPNF